MKKSVHLLFAVAMLFIFGLADSTNACDEDCDPCFEWDDNANGGAGGCVAACLPEYCCGDACRECCESSQCSDSNCEVCTDYHCVSDCSTNNCEVCNGAGNCVTTCDPNVVCCNGVCCPEGYECSDGECKKPCAINGSDCDSSNCEYCFDYDDSTHKFYCKSICDDDRQCVNGQCTCVYSYDCYNCQECVNGICVDDNGGCDGNCEVCEHGLCYPNQDMCPGNCESCELDSVYFRHDCKEDEDQCPGDCYNCFFGNCEEQSYLCGCGDCVNHNCQDNDDNCPDVCLSCVDGDCIYCDSETEVCCDDGCRSKCQETTNSSSCSEDNNQTCAYCSPEGSLCDEIAIQKIYLGNSFTECEEEGCDDDCWHTEILCAVETLCTEDWPIWCHACAADDENGFYCYELPIELILWPCKKCKTVTFGSNIYVGKGSCIW